MSEFWDCTSSGAAVSASFTVRRVDMLGLWIEEILGLL